VKIRTEKKSLKKRAILGKNLKESPMYITTIVEKKKSCKFVIQIPSTNS
jgi:hypothetical protein